MHNLENSTDLCEPCCKYYVHTPKIPPQRKTPPRRGTHQEKNKKKHIKYSKYDNFKLHKKQEVTYSVKQDKHKKKQQIIINKYH